MGRIKDILTARQEARHQQAQTANDDLLRDADLAWDAVLDTLPLHAQPGRMVTGLPPRITFRNEGDTV